MRADDRSISTVVDDRLRDWRPISPKRPSRGAPTEAWYSYYAGYADGFVREIVDTLDFRDGLLLDPWNGAGTTTSVATAAHKRSVGIDLNPAAVVIARARLLMTDVHGSVDSLTSEVIASAARLSEELDDDDPLLNWFDRSTSTHLRALERSIYRLLVSSDDEQRLLNPSTMGHVSSLAALFYLGLFRTIRPLLERFIGSNPTWIKRNVDAAELLEVPQAVIAQNYREAMQALKEAATRAHNTRRDPCPWEVRLGESWNTGLAADSVDAVITSPPYCTRIDYVIATLPELAALGARKDEIAALRATMIGTPVVRGANADEPLPGKKLPAFIKAVDEHDSYAARSYYLKFYRSYFAGMERSFEELARVTKPGAWLVFVAQDSWFKQLHVPVPELLAEMGERRGWRVDRRDHPVVWNRAGMHPHGRTYRSSTRATESVLVFTTT